MFMSRQGAAGRRPTTRDGPIRPRRRAHVRRLGGTIRGSALPTLELVVRQHRAELRAEVRKLGRRELAVAVRVVVRELGAQLGLGERARRLFDVSSGRAIANASPRRVAVSRRVGRRRRWCGGDASRSPPRRPEQPKQGGEEEARPSFVSRSGTAARARARAEGGVAGRRRDGGARAPRWSSTSAGRRAWWRPGGRRRTWRSRGQRCRGR